MKNRRILFISALFGSLILSGCGSASKADASFKLFNKTSRVEKQKTISKIELYRSPKSILQHTTPKVEDFSITATFDDNSIEPYLTPESVTLDTNIAGDNVEGIVFYKGKTDEFKIKVIENEVVEDPEEEYPLKEHHFEYVPESGATCTDYGMKAHYICTDEGCERKFFDENGYRVREISLRTESPLGHEYQEDPQLRYLKSEADCIHAAVYYKACIRCGKQGNGTFIGGVPNGHTYNKASRIVSETPNGKSVSYKGDNYATEFTVTAECSECGHVESQTKQGTFSTQVANAPQYKDSTCTENGLALISVPFTSEFGGVYTKDVVLPAKHDVSGVNYSSDGTNHWKECPDCSEHVETSAHLLDYVYNESTHKQECSVCGYTCGEANHVFGSPTVSILDETSKTIRATKSCICGYEIHEDKVGELNVITPSTCSTAGMASLSVEFSSEFGGSYTNSSIELPKKPHNSDGILCNDELGHFYHCVDCGQETGREEHNVTNWETLSYPSATSLGEQKGVCSTCGRECTRALSYCENGQHVGKHYQAKATSKYEGGYKEFYYCEICHKVILGTDHLDGDGTWTDSSEQIVVTKDNPAFINPTISLDEVNELVNELGTGYSGSYVPTLADYFKFNKVKQSADAYLSRTGEPEKDLTNYKTYKMFKDKFNLVHYSLKGVIKDNITKEYSYPGDVYTNDLVDETTSIPFMRNTLSQRSGPWQPTFYFNTPLFQGASKNVAFMLRFSEAVEMNIVKKNNGKYTSVYNRFTTEKDKWYYIELNADDIKDEKDLIYIQAISVLTGGIKMDISDFYEVWTEEGGTHYSGVSPTATTSGIKECWVNGFNGEIYSTKPSTGTYTEGSASDIDITHPAYLAKLCENYVFNLNYSSEQELADDFNCEDSHWSSFAISGSNGACISIDPSNYWNPTFKANANNVYLHGYNSYDKNNTSLTYTFKDDELISLKTFSFDYKNTGGNDGDSMITITGTLLNGAKVSFTDTPIHLEKGEIGTKVINLNGLYTFRSITILNNPNVKYQSHVIFSNIHASSYNNATLPVSYKTAEDAVSDSHWNITTSNSNPAYCNRLCGLSMNAAVSYVSEGSTNFTSDASKAWLGLVVSPWQDASATYTFDEETEAKFLSFDYCQNLTSNPQNNDGYGKLHVYAVDNQSNETEILAIEISSDNQIRSARYCFNANTKIKKLKFSLSGAHANDIGVHLKNIVLLY